MLLSHGQCMRAGLLAPAHLGPTVSERLCAAVLGHTRFPLGSSPPLAAAWGFTPQPEHPSARLPFCLFTIFHYTWNI